ncbi:putative ethylene-responsive transcription factor-like [Capsicum annuum]|nr:putative ethylene-responsive transcription factor-like [Capsicum annuum]
MVEVEILWTWILDNVYGSLHGGAVGAVAERVAIACARTIVGKDKELFLGELSISYLSGTTQNAEVIVNASIVRSGRNLTVVAMDFRLKDSEKLSYISRATFYHMPVQLNGDNNFPPQHGSKDDSSQLIRGCIKFHSIHPGKVSFILSVKPAILTYRKERALEQWEGCSFDDF